MKRQDFASSDRGSMLPLFLGLVALSLVLSLGVAEFGSMFILREKVQATADQIALKSSFSHLTNQAQVGDLLAGQDSKFYLANFQILDGQTVELMLCGDWRGWIRLPGLGFNTQVCAKSASR
jgi:hypothetical protein